MSEVINLLARPVYGMGQVDDILRLPAGTARRWIDGYTRSRKAYPPVVREVSTGADLVTWGEFVETRLLAEYRSAGVPMINLRPTVDRLRDAFAAQYPLATARAWLEQEGREIVYRAQGDADLVRPLLLIVVRNDQLMWSQRASDFVHAATFKDGLVARIQPAHDLDQVFLDPLRRAGDPVVRSVPTDVLAELYRAGDPPETLAELYQLTLEQVHQALRFEMNRRRPVDQAA